MWNIAVSIGLLFFAVNWQYKLDLIYCRLLSFIFFRIAGQVDQHHHVLNPDADEFISGFQETRAFETNVFGKLELGYNWSIVWNAHSLLTWSCDFLCWCGRRKTSQARRICARVTFVSFPLEWYQATQTIELFHLPGSSSSPRLSTQFFFTATWTYPVEQAKAPPEWNAQFWSWRSWQSQG